jgi:hypothetical protein
VCGLFATGLGWEATRSRTGAFFHRPGFGLAPVVFGRLADGQWNFSTTAPLALCAWLLLRLAHRPTVARSIALGIGLVAAGYAEYTYLLFLLFLTGFMARRAVLGLGRRVSPLAFQWVPSLVGSDPCRLMAPVLPRRFGVNTSLAASSRFIEGDSGTTPRMWRSISFQPRACRFFANGRAPGLDA